MGFSLDWLTLLGHAKDSLWSVDLFCKKRLEKME